MEFVAVLFLGLLLGKLSRCRWEKCDTCCKAVRVDKPIFGSLHVCLTEAEKASRAYVRGLIQAQVQDIANQKRRAEQARDNALFGLTPP